MNSAGKEKRDALLGELESIRTLLQEEAQNITERAWLTQHGNIPVLVADDLIPTLGPADHHHETLTPSVSDTHKPETNPLQAIRDAAAKVAANHSRHHANMENTPPNFPVTTSQTKPSTLPALIPSQRSREKLVDDIVRSALPRLESLLRELVQEALLQEKLRGGKR